MENEMVKRDELDVAVSDIERMTTLSRALMATKHYTKLGEAGIFAIVMKARSLGLNPMEALNGGMYCISGKVELSSTLMAKLIRQKGHSVTKARESDETKCILHGKRADNADTWCCSFSLDDARRAGLLSNPTWQKYPGTMCYNRALSLLARQLFPDVIGNSYVEGETTDVTPTDAPTENAEMVEATGEVVEADPIPRINQDQEERLDELIGNDDELRGQLMAFINRQFKASSLDQVPAANYDAILVRVEAKAKARRERPTEIAIGILNQAIVA